MSPFPKIESAGGSVNPSQYIASGTGLATFGGFILGTLLLLIGILASCGTLLIVLIFYPALASSLNKKATALLHGSGVKVNENQFPEIHQCAMAFKERLGIKNEVQVYIVEANIINAAAVRYGKKNVVLLTDDLIHGCLTSGHPEALGFVIGHEMAHIALNHTGAIRSWMARSSKKLGRLDEYSADAVAAALVQDKTAAFYGLLLLTVGYSLLLYVNPGEILQQAGEVTSNKHSKKAENELTHPLLLNRIARITQTV